ncbi:MAG: alpha/beta fold hydrolase [Burkholderiales bacterium]|nr:alpha/beta fold hydrolase [Burkholderiales bacterium]
MLLRWLSTVSALTTLATVSDSAAVRSASPVPRAAQVGQAPLVMEEFMVPGGDPGIQLYVRNKRLATLNTFSADHVLLFVHGATYPAPIVDSEVAARDYAAAADWIRTRRQVPRLHVMGHSWGTVITARYATQHSDKISRLVLLAPVWLRQDGASLTDSGGALGAYRTVTIEAARKRKDTGLRPDVKPQPDAWFDAWAQATFASDPVGSKANPPYVRAPNGVVQEGRTFWSAGKAVYDPARIRVPTLLILAEWDADTPPYMAQTLYPLLVNAHPKKLVLLSQGTHGIMNELERFSLFDEVYRFLSDGLQS